ncbi:FAD-dependent oxidoreductase [Streptomyces sp. NPDC003077]|uniref:NAD(P)/FAD-dependent oxidoreductase n=1 Tax=Streptomyces sp. NPDC003077 TaxID=3154443 RepID=UPI0033A37BAA
MKEPARILIVGGGCTGVYTALRLQRKLKREIRRRTVRITVVDPDPLMTYRPFLPEAAAGSLSPVQVVVPLRQALPACEVITGDITALDHDQRRATVLTEAAAEAGTGGTELAYDELVLVPSPVPRPRPASGTRGAGIGLRTAQEAAALRDHVLEQLDLACSTRDPALREAALTFVFAGGGHAGVQVLAELEDMTRHALRSFPTLTPDDTRWVLAEATDRLLPEADEELGRHALRELRERDIEVRFNTRVTSYEHRLAVLDDGTRIPTRTAVWTTGFAPHPILAASGFPVNARGRLRCTADLRVHGVPHAWSAGETAAVPDLTADQWVRAAPETEEVRRDLPDAAPVPHHLTGEGGRRAVDAPEHGRAHEPGRHPAGAPIPQPLCAATGQDAARQAKALADNLVASLRGTPTHEYRSKHTGTVVTLGLHKGVGQAYGRRLRGYPAWLAHRVYHLSRVPTPHRKARVLAEWTLTGLFKREVVPLGSPARPGAAPGLVAGGGRDREAG